MLSWSSWQVESFLASVLEAQCPYWHRSELSNFSIRPEVLCSLMCVQKIVLVWVGFLLYTGMGVPSRIRFPHPSKAALGWMLFVLLRIEFGVKACSSTLCSYCLDHPRLHQKSSKQGDQTPSIFRVLPGLRNRKPAGKVLEHLNSCC